MEIPRAGCIVSDSFKAAKFSRALLFVAVLLVPLGGCGFHLRGAEPLPAALAGVRLQPAGQNDEALVRALRQRLMMASQSVETAPNAPVLVVSGTSIEQRVASIDQQGVAREFLLILHTRYRLRAPSGEDLLPEQSIKIQRDYTYTSTNVLATDIQAQSLRDELLRDGAEQILRALSYYKGSAQPAARGGQ